MADKSGSTQTDKKSRPGIEIEYKMPTKAVPNANLQYYRLITEYPMGRYMATSKGPGTKVLSRFLQTFGKSSYRFLPLSFSIIIILYYAIYGSTHKYN